MKLSGKMMVVAAMVVGSMAAMGCSKPDALGGGPVAPEESVATAPVVDQGSAASANGGVEKDERRVRYYAPRPPALRFEERGRAPSERHFWAPGYWHWSGRDHVWMGGRWEMRRPGFEYIAPHWQLDGAGRWEYVPGYWLRLS
jgi:hypothetical protein